MTEIKTTRRRAGQARTRQKVSRRAKTIALYACLTVGGILLFRAGATVAYEQRGCIAVGGEVFFLFLPLFYYLFSETVSEAAADIKKIMEECHNEKTC